MRSDRWYKLGRTLLYGRLEDEKPFHSVRRLVQYEDYILRLFSDAGLPVPHPLGIVEITPEREYLLVTEFIDGAKEVGEAEIDDAIIDQGLSVVRRMWEIGMAHRDIKPANLLVRDGTLFVIDSAFAEVRPSPWRQAVDLANMMLVLGLRTDAERVYARARRQFSDEEIAEAFAATRGLTMPSQLRRMLRQQGRDLHGDFLRLLPYRLPPVRIQRWTWRRVGLTVVDPASALVVAVADHRQPARVAAVRPPRGRRSLARARRAAARRLRPGRRRCARRAASPAARATTATPANGVVLMAQSVPTASWVPCLDGMPLGWHFVRHGGPTTARAGSGWTPTGDGDARHRGAARPSPATPSGATEIPSDRDGACDRLERVIQVTPHVRRARGTTCSTAAASPCCFRLVRREPRRAAGRGHPGRRRRPAGTTCASSVREESGGRLELDPDRRDG